MEHQHFSPEQEEKEEDQEEELLPTEINHFTDEKEEKEREKEEESDEDVDELLPTEIFHFSHECVLSLFNGSGYEACDCCMRPISPPSYRCVDCNFFLHQTCIDLPTKIDHPLHQHPLTLIPKSTSDDGIFYCQGCKNRRQGFVYHCEKCIYFDIDVSCGSVPHELKHVGHPHFLYLTNHIHELQCSACGSSAKQVFQCKDCPFTLDYRCATLPHTLQHKSYLCHPFILTYDNIDDGSDEYYCDVCEELRDPKQWFYYCSPYDFSAHPKCVLNKHLYIRIGSHYNYPPLHPHTLTFVEGTQLHNLPPCHRCSSTKDKSLLVACLKPECSYTIHWDCI